MMYDGFIDLSNFVTEQPNRVLVNGAYGYPAGYSGDRNDAGNRIYMISTVDGTEYRIGYFHLQAGTPLAINPRTGNTFAKGDIVYQGDIVAYAGITGNAINVPSPHLHLCVQLRSTGQRINPTIILNGTLPYPYHNFENIDCN